MHNIIEANRILKQKDSEEHQHHALLVAIHTSSLQVRKVFLLLFQKVCTRVVRIAKKKKGSIPITLPCDTHSEIVLITKSHYSQRVASRAIFCRYFTLCELANQNHTLFGDINLARK